MNASTAKLLFVVNPRGHREAAAARAALIAVALGLSACGGNSSPAEPAPNAPARFTSIEGARGSSGTSCEKMACVYVTNMPKDRHDPGSYALAFAANTSGNVPPVATIRGTNTGLEQPEGIALDAYGNIYVTNHAVPPRVEVFPPGANGNVPPLRTITGLRTGLKFPTGIALDAAGNTYVADFESESSASGSVKVYAPGANGNVAPLRTIKGGRTFLAFPIGIALDASLNIYVASAGQFGGVSVYAPDAHGDAKPLRTIHGDRTQLNNPIGVALDADGKIYVGNGQGDQLNVYPAAADGNVAPVRVIAGPHTKLRFLVGITLDAAGNLYVEDSPQAPPGVQSFVRIYAAGANGDVAPLQSIGGSNTELESPGGAGIAVH